MYKFRLLNKTFHTLFMIVVEEHNAYITKIYRSSPAIPENCVKLLYNYLLELLNNNGHAAKRLMVIARSFFLVSLSFLLLLLISMLTRRRNSLGAPIKRRRVETRKWSDVSQIAFLAARYLRSFRLGLFRALFFLEPHKSLRNSRQEFGWMIHPRSKFSAVLSNFAQEPRKFTIETESAFFIYSRQGQACTLTPRFD